MSSVANDKRVKFRERSSEIFLESYANEPDADVIETFPETQPNFTMMQQVAQVFDKKLVNILLLGLGFMFSMGSYSTCAMSQTVILRSVNDTYYQGTSTSGYSLLCVVYGSTAVSFLLAPSVSALVGPKIAMVMGAAYLMCYVTTFLRPVEMLMYAGAVAQGMGQGLIWTVYGHFFTTNSDKDTMGRNAGIFWCLFQSNLVIGNMFYFLVMRGVDTISEESRLIITVALISSACVGVVILSMLRHPWRMKKKQECDKLSGEKAHGPLIALVGMAKMACTKKMLMLIPVYIYMGLDLSFFISVYGTSLGYTEKFGDIREALVGLNGVFIGIGQILGGMILASIGGTFSRRFGRDPALLFGTLMHLLAYYLAFLNLPTNSPLMMTNENSFLGANPSVAMLCSFLLGFGDAAWNNQLFALLGTLYPQEVECVSAFAIFQFVQCAGASVAFFYTPVCTLHNQLIILVVMALLGTWGFCMVEWEAASLEMQQAKELAIEKLSLLSKQRIVEDKNESFELRKLYPKL